MSAPTTPPPVPPPPLRFSLDADRAFDPFEPDDSAASALLDAPEDDISLVGLEIGDGAGNNGRQHEDTDDDAPRKSYSKNYSNGFHSVDLGYGRASARPATVRRHSYHPGSYQQELGLGMNGPGSHYSHQRAVSGTQRGDAGFGPPHRDFELDHHDLRTRRPERVRNGSRPPAPPASAGPFSRLGNGLPSLPSFPHSRSHSRAHSQTFASHPSHSFTHAALHTYPPDLLPSLPSLPHTPVFRRHRRTSSRARPDLSVELDLPMPDELDEHGESGEYDQIVDDKMWTAGDFELVSADRVRFRVPSYFLFASSPRFREASGEVGIESGLRLPSRRAIHLTDEGESAAVLRLFLEFLVYAKLDVPDDGTTLVGLATIKDLVQLMKTWECGGTLSLFLVCLREAARAPSNISPLAVFIAGATAGDAFTCSVALDITDWAWRRMDTHNLPAAPDANVFDPHHMPVTVWQLIPPMYTWALTTAWTGTDDHLRKKAQEPKEGQGRRSASRRYRASASESQSHRDTASRCESVLGRKVQAWQQWL